MILCSAEARIISCLPTHVINLVINDNSLEIIYKQNYYEMTTVLLFQYDDIPKIIDIVSTGQGMAVIEVSFKSLINMSYSFTNILLLFSLPSA